MDGGCLHVDRPHASRKYPASGEPNSTPVSSEARMSRVAVIGAGAWGTALAIVLGRKGNHDVRLWAHEKEVCESITSRRINEMFLPEHRIPEPVSATQKLEEALADAEIVLS